MQCADHSVLDTADPGVQVNGLFEHNDGVDDCLTGSVPGRRTCAINVDCLVVEAALKRIRLHVVRWISAYEVDDLHPDHEDECALWSTTGR